MSEELTITKYFPILAAFIGFGAGLIFTFLKDKLDLKSRKKECDSSIQLFGMLLNAAIENRNTNSHAVIDINEISRRLFSCRYGDDFGWNDYIELYAIYTSWLSGNLTKSTDISDPLQRLNRSIARISANLK
jgi:hypothetical protein